MLPQKLFEIRKKRKMSQESLAEKIGVSRQAIQKWEAGTSRPDSENLLSLARVLGVTTDTLLGNDTRTIEELRLGRELIPDYSDAHKWDTYQSQLRLEYRQSYDEGRDIERFQGLFAEVERIAPGPAAYQADWPLIATSMGPEKHTAYAVQWFALAFALLGLYLYLGWHTAQEKRHGNGHQSV